jgi:hypothetical protein
MKITRRHFLGTSLATVALVGCGGGGDDGGGGGQDATASAKSCTDNGTTTQISSNHGHVLTVSAADVSAGADKTYDIQGSAAHTHSVMVTAANFASLQSDPTSSVMITSSPGGGHTHQITILCA